MNLKNLIKLYGTCLAKVAVDEIDLVEVRGILKGIKCTTRNEDVFDQCVYYIQELDYFIDKIKEEH